MESISQWLTVNEVFGSKLQLILFTAILTPVIYGIFVFAKVYREAAHIAKHVNKLPGRPTHILWGNLHEFTDIFEGILNRFRENMETHGFRRVYRSWFGPLNPVVTVNHPETMKIMLKSSQPKYLPGNSNSGYAMMLPWLGEGLLISDGKRWARSRRLLTPAFHFDILKGYMAVYNDACNTFVEHLTKASSGGQYVEMFESVSMCTLDVILKCAFSYEENVQATGKRNPYVQGVLELSYLFNERFMDPLLSRFEFLYKLTRKGRQCFNHCDHLHKVAEAVIEKRKKALSTNPDAVQKRYLDFLDILLSARDEDGQGLTDLEIRNEVDTFLFEGHDTTASAISWTLYSLAKHPQFQEKVQKEIDDLLEGRATDEFVWDDLQQLPYLTLCIKEAMRLWSPVPMIGRQLESDVQIMDVTLPKGTLVDINIYSTHHNPDVWGDDHMEYKPERMSIENTRNMDAFAFVPFSAGPRNCIGQNFAMNEEKIVIATVLRNFLLEPDPERRPIPAPALVMRAKDGMYLKLTPRM